MKSSKRGVLASRIALPRVAGAIPHPSRMINASGARDCDVSVMVNVDAFLNVEAARFPSLHLALATQANQERSGLRRQEFLRHVRARHRRQQYMALGCHCGENLFF